MDDFINTFFFTLNKNNINYAVLRNYEYLPKKDSRTEYFDLELIVLSKEYKKFFIILDEISSEYKLKIAKQINRETLKQQEFLN